MRPILLLTAGMAFALVASASADERQGFNTADLGVAAGVAQTRSAVADVREFAAQTEVLRAAFVLSPVKGWNVLSASETRALGAAFGAARPLGDDAVQWFMRGASTSISDRDMTGLYNPLADVWLVLRWQKVGGAPRITDAAFVPGVMVRDNDDATAWTDRSAPYGEALAQSALQARTGFTTLSSERFFSVVSPMRPATSDLAFTSVMTWMGSLRHWGTDKDRPRQWRALRNDLIEGRAGDQVSALPSGVRASLIPMGMIRHDQGSSVLLMSPLAPQVVVTVDYGAKGKRNLALINLANARKEP